jgi:hypothetical protein
MAGPGSPSVLRLQGPLADLLITKQLKTEGPTMGASRPDAATTASDSGTGGDADSGPRYGANLWGDTSRVLTVHPDDAAALSLVLRNFVVRSGGPNPVSAAAEADRLFLIPLFVQARQQWPPPSSVPAHRWVPEIAGLVLRRKQVFLADPAADNGGGGGGVKVKSSAGSRSPGGGEGGDCGDQATVVSPSRFTRVGIFTARGSEGHDKRDGLQDVVRWLSRMEERSIEIA